jgi:hypothetical protein
VRYCNTDTFQAAKDVRASQDTLVDIFERMEMFFRRLEVYTELSPTAEMIDIITQIMVEVLSILGIATKEIKQSRISESFSTNVLRLTDRCLEKYGKKLIGRTDMEDALKKLDKLTQEEARMAVAQSLKATHNVDERVRGVADTAVAIDNRVADVSDQVAGVDDRVARVDDRVKGVRDQVLVMDDKIKQAANDVDQVKRSSSNLIGTHYRPLHIISEIQLRESIHKWLTPPDPSTNHNIACSTHHKKAATWFFQGTFFREWKSTGSLLWVHGKRAPSPTSHLVPSDEVLNCSWLRQEYSLVSGCFTQSIIRD